ncbi:MAG TPA: Clp protease N-terminal domain-containing protein [Acidimicrobiales bacterium]
MFERFTARARNAVVLAQEEARRLDHNYIGTEHVLLGLLREPEGVAGRALRRLGISLEAVRSSIEQIIGRGGERPPEGHIPFTPRAKKVLELSLREALQLGHNYIGTEHILLGLIREGEGVAAQILVQRGADLERVRKMVMEELGRVRATADATAIERTPAADEIITAAQEISGPAPMGSHHLLEALARADDSLAAKALQALGVDADTLAAKIDELGIDGTSDLTPEQAAARRMEVRLEGDEVHIVLRDDASIAVVRAVADELGTPIRGDDPTAASLVGLWLTTMAGLSQLRQDVAPTPDDEAAEQSRSALVREIIQSRLRRRKRRS